MIMPCMVMNWEYFSASMNDSAPGNPSCMRISQDSTSATVPMASAVPAYCTAMILASWEKTYFVHQLCGW
jgi:hypothetical protein